MKLTKTQLKQIIKEELEEANGPIRPPAGRAYKVTYEFGGEYVDELIIKNAEKVTSSADESGDSTILIIDHIEIDLQYGMKVLKIKEASLFTPADGGRPFYK